MTVLFSDIAGFTTLSENLPPEKLSKALNVYLSRMTEVVFKITAWWINLSAMR